MSDSLLWAKCGLVRSPLALAVTNYQIMLLTDHMIGALIGFVVSLTK